jgi:hypothetical protein
VKLINKIKKADFSRKTRLWMDADMTADEARALVADMVLAVPVGHYKLHDREYGTNLVDAVYAIYGWMPSMLIDAPMILGLACLHPDRVYASFTLGLDAIEIK